MNKILYTKTFENCIKKFRKEKDLMKILFKRIKDLKYEPKGKFLVGKLSGYKSIRVAVKYRLIYKYSNKNEEITLVVFGHRKIVYELDPNLMCL